MEKYNRIQWVVQRNLTSQADFEGIRNACEKIGIPFIGLDIIPFTPQLPEFDRSRKSIIYGSTTFNALAYEDVSLREGLFFDAQQFSIENYIDKWGHHMLNYEANISSFKELMESKEIPHDKLLFIRPDDDSKSFAGEMKRFDEIKSWFNTLITVENSSLSADSRIVISEPYNIQFEWRLWIVNGRVVAASKYREYFKLRKEEGCPAAVRAFAEERCREYTPDDAFVMDVCLCGDEYYIVECGCLNGAGFYKANIDDIINNVSEYFISMV
jgi:hypothetical protein